MTDLQPDIDPAEPLIPPGSYWNGMKVVDNPAFALIRQQHHRRPSKAERLFNTALYAAQSLARQGIPVTVDTLHSQNPDVTYQLYRDLMGSEKFQAALEARGIDVLNDTGLTPQQMSALAIYMDMSAKQTHPQKLKAAGVTDAKWQGWMRQPAFAAYLNDTAEMLLRNSTPVALQRVSEAIDAGERWAIELGFEMTGRHDRRQQQLDFGDVLVALFSVLDDEGVPAATMTRIAAKVRGMMGQQAPQQIITVASQPTPRSAPEVTS